jgi:hypothetical protein
VRGYVYVAAPMTGYPGEYLANVARMSAYSRRLMDAGYCTINPAADIIEGLAGGEPMTTAAYQERSLDLLRLLAGRDDAEMHVLGTHHADGRESQGVAAEIRECTRLGVVVVFVGGES